MNIIVVYRETTCRSAQNDAHACRLGSGSEEDVLLCGVKVVTTVIKIGTVKYYIAITRYLRFAFSATISLITEYRATQFTILWY